MRDNIKRRKTIILIAAAVLLAGIGFAAGMMAKSTLASGNKDIGMDTAKEIALASVGVSFEKATFTKAEYDENSYEIDFYTETNNYEFDINKETGAIIDREVSPRNLNLPDPANDSAKSADITSAAEKQQSGSPAASASQPAASKQPATQNNNSDDSVIGVAAAKEIALAHAGVSGASFQETSLDYDDGIRVYDIEFIAGNKSYDYEINAYSGTILDYDIDRLEYDDD